MLQVRNLQGAKRLNVLFLYDAMSMHINTVYDHLASFSYYSRHNVVYSPATGKIPLQFPLDLFDVVVLHYSVRIALDWHISPAFREALTKFQGQKIVFIQDEYDHTWHASMMINQLGVDVVFTCVPEDKIRTIYSLVSNRVKFVRVLTGYLPLEFSERRLPPVHERKTLIGYRGRELPYRYGNLAREKHVIGTQMRAICEERKVACDIEWTEDKRIYGADWLDFTASCKTTLGAESGSNVFDFDGSLMRKCNTYLKKKPTASYEEFYADCIGDREIDGLMNQISPRVFEAISMRTGLILFEGEYSGVIRPYEHFLPLRKDFSNIDEVLARVYDDEYLEAMIDRAYRHVVGSGQYTYEKFVETVESHFAPKSSTSRAPELVGCLIGGVATGLGTLKLYDGKLFTKPLYYQEVAEYHAIPLPTPVAPPAPLEFDFDEKVFVLPPAWENPVSESLTTDAGWQSQETCEHAPILVMESTAAAELDGPRPATVDLSFSLHGSEGSPSQLAALCFEVNTDSKIEEAPPEPLEATEPESDEAPASTLPFVVKRHIVWPNFHRVKQAIKALCFEYREEAA